MEGRTVTEIVIAVIHILLVVFYAGFVNSRKGCKGNLKFETRCLLNRLFVLAAILVSVMLFFGIFGERYSLPIFSVCVFWGTFLLMNTLGWCCDKCGRRIGIRILFSNKCPHCRHSEL